MARAPARHRCNHYLAIHCLQCMCSINMARRLNMPCPAGRGAAATAWGGRHPPVGASTDWDGYRLYDTPFAEEASNGATRPRR